MLQFQVYNLVIPQVYTLGYAHPKCNPQQMDFVSLENWYQKNHLLFKC